MTFIVLLKYTAQGIQNIKETSERAHDFKETVEAKFGVAIKHQYWTTGEYDLVHIVEAPNDEAVMAMAFSLGAVGNVRTETMRAYSAEEIKDILDKI